MKACPSKQWSLDNVVNHLLLIKCLKDQPCHKLGMLLSTYGQPLMFLDDLTEKLTTWLLDSVSKELQGLFCNYKSALQEAGFF